METKFGIFISLTIFEGVLATLMGLVNFTGEQPTGVSGLGGFGVNLVQNFSSFGPFSWLFGLGVVLWFFLLAYIIKDSINPVTATP